MAIVQRLIATTNNHLVNEIIGGLAGGLRFGLTLGDATTSTPTMMGMGLQLTPAAMSGAIPILIGHIVYGVATARVYLWLARRLPRQPPPKAAQPARGAARVAAPLADMSLLFGLLQWYGLRR